MTPKEQLVKKKKKSATSSCSLHSRQTVCTRLLPTSLSTGNKAKKGLPNLPGVLQSTGSQRVRHDWTTELNWTELVSTMKRNTLLFPHEAISWGERPRVEVARFCNQSFKWTKARGFHDFLESLLWFPSSQKQCLWSQFLEEVLPYGMLGLLSQTKPSWGCTEHSIHFIVPVLQIWQREGARDFKSHGNAEFDRSGSQMPPGLTESRCPHISRYDFNHIFFDLAIVKLCLYDKLNLNFLHHCHLYGFVKRMNDWEPHEAW